MLFTRLFPKSKAVALNEAVVTRVAIVTEVLAVRVSVPEVAVRAMLAMPDVAFEDADMLIFAGEPAARDRIDGVAMTPAGSDPTVIATPPGKAVQRRGNYCYRLRSPARNHRDCRWSGYERKISLALRFLVAPAATAKKCGEEDSKEYRWRLHIPLGSLRGMAPSKVRRF